MIGRESTLFAGYDIQTEWISSEISDMTFNSVLDEDSVSKSSSDTWYVTAVSINLTNELFLNER